MDPVLEGPSPSRCGAFCCPGCRASSEGVEVHVKLTALFEKQATEDSDDPGLIHRGLSVVLPEHVHRFVHDENQPAGARAHMLLAHVRKAKPEITSEEAKGTTGGLGNYWSPRKEKAAEYGDQGGWKAYHDHEREHDCGDPESGYGGCPSTHVVLHAGTPPEKHHWTENFRDGERYDPDVSWRLPVRPDSKLMVHGISWKQGHDNESGAHRDFSAEKAEPYSRYDFLRPMRKRAKVTFGPGADEHIGEDEYDPDETWEHKGLWDRWHPQLQPTIHRHLAVEFPSGHPAHDKSAPVEDRARAVVDHVSQKDGYGRQGKVGWHWTDDPNYKHLSTGNRMQPGQTKVTLHAQTPPREHIEDADWLLQDRRGVRDWDTDPEREVPVKRNAPVKITGVSWDSHDGPQHHTFAEPITKRASLPQEWYHGSGAAFDRFDLGKNKTVQDEDDGKHWNSHLGAHFTSDHKVAQEFAQRQGGGQVYHVQLGLRNPKHYESEHDLDKHAVHWALGKGYDLGPSMTNPAYRQHTEPDEWQFHLTYGEDGNHRPEAPEIAHGFRDHLKSQGHDGITYGNEFESAANGFHAGERHLSAVAFHPDQVSITQRHGGGETHHTATKADGGPVPEGTLGTDSQGHGVQMTTMDGWAHRDGSHGHEDGPDVGQRPVYTQDHTWLPEGRYWGPNSAQNDQRLFSGDHLRPEVRQDILDRVGGVLGAYDGWEKWTRVYFAGSQAAQWLDQNGQGNGDFDILIGIDFEEFRGLNPQFEEIEDAEIATTLTDELWAKANAKEYYFTLHDGRSVGPFDRTFYCNPRAWDIKALHPYAAYNVTSDDWAVHPLQVPKNWSAKSLPESYWGYAEALLAEIKAIGQLPPEERHRMAENLWEELHSHRSDAFADGGHGLFDLSNVAEKYLDQHPDHPWEQLVQWKNESPSGTSPWVPTTARRTTLTELFDPKTAADGADYGGVMIAIVPPKDICEKLAQEDGEPVEAMHITLAYMPGQDRRKAARVLPELVEGWARTQKAMTARIGGVGTFVNPGQHVLWAAVDIPHGGPFRQSLVETLERHEYEVANDHGWTPHITLDYRDHHVRFLPKVEPVSWDVTEVMVCIGDNWTAVPLG
jgi:2'-5' RNA ligase